MDKELDSVKSNSGVLEVYRTRLNDLRIDGKQYSAKCPFHSENTGSFKLHFHEGVWLFKCLGGQCQKNGNIFQFVQEFDHIPFRQAVERVKAELGLTWEGGKQKVDEVFRPVTEQKKNYKQFTLEEYAAFERNLAKNEEGKKYLLEKRGITYETAKKLHLGYRKSIPFKSDQPNADIAEQGWISFPCIRDGQVVGIKYRSIVRKVFSRQAGMETELFGLPTIDSFEPLYITEGEFDAAVLEQAGFKAISLPGASHKPTPQQKDMIMEAGCVILAGDNDEAGAPVMQKLWSELQERTFLLKWPQGIKDANQLFLESAKRDVGVFRKLICDLTTAARANPMPHISDLQHAMMRADRTNLADSPNRLRFPWPSVDKMAILLPGSTMSLFATNTKMGKTCFTTNFSLYGAMVHNEVVLNYQCELGTDEFSNLAAAHILGLNRNSLTREDYQQAAKKIAGIRYYVGRDQTLTTVTPVLDLIEMGIRRLGATLVILDHLHFICRNEENEVQAQANAYQRIKNMAGKYNVKFIVVGQPRKTDKANRGKMVHISDGKGSESFTSDADAVFAIHRDWIKVKDPNNPPQDDYSPETEVHLLGARAKGNGSTFCKLQFFGPISTFREIATTEAPDD